MPPTEAPEQSEETPVSLPTVAAPVVPAVAVPSMPEPVEAMEAKMGRPTKYDPLLGEVVVSAMRADASIREAASAAGVHHNTVYRWIRSGEAGASEELVRFVAALRETWWGRQGDAGVREVVEVPALGDRRVEVEWQTAVYLVHEDGRFLGSIRHERNGGLFEWSVHAPNDIERPCADKEAGVNFLTGLTPEPLLSERQRETLILEATRALAAIVAAKEAWERAVLDDAVDDQIEEVFDAIDQASATVDFLPRELRDSTGTKPSPLLP